MAREGRQLLVDPSISDDYIRSYVVLSSLIVKRTVRSSSSGLAVADDFAIYARTRCPRPLSALHSN